MERWDRDMSVHDRLAMLMAEQADRACDVEARELLAAVRQRMFARTAEPLQLGRYRELRRIGAGGMGIVYEAYDPSLDRRVALKVLRKTLPSGPADVLREARALAQVSHPNIVAVLDVGTDGDEAFIAMELVHGRTLAEWIAHARPPPLRIVEVLADVGRGLAAAHARGIVHRDLKPSNVLVGEDGRVRVTDFGLAAQRSASDTERSALDEPSAGSGSTTRHGGTLGYAAPEQLARDPGSPVDVRVDQFALGVCLYEALRGERPFPSPTAAVFAATVRAGPPAMPAAEVPRAIAAVLARALAAAPEQRFVDMTALVEALVGATRSRSRRGALGFGAAIAGAMLVWGAITWDSLEPPDARCPAAQELAVTWSDALRAQASAAFRATELPYASTSFAAVDHQLGTAISRWSDEYAQICRAGPVDAQDERFDARLACLEEHRAGLEALAALFGRADATTVEHAVESVSSLPSATACREPAARGRAVGVSAEDREIQAELARQSATARALVTAGAYDEAARALGDVPNGLDEAVHASHLAEHATLRGRVAALRGQPEPAREQLRAAYHLATAAADDRLAAIAAGELTVVVGVDLAQVDEGLQWQRHAEAALARWNAGGVETARIHTALASLHRTRGEFREAERRLELARALLEATDTPPDHRVAGVLTALGAVLHDEGRHQESLPLLDRSRALIEASLGPHHPRVIATLVDLGVTHQELGDLDASTRVLTRALEVARASLGPDHVETAAVENNIGNVAVARGDDDEARVHFERALATFSTRLGPDHPMTVTPLVNLGSIHARAGRHERAREHFEPALATLRTTKGTDDPSVAQLLVNLGHGEQEQGHADQARARYEEALAIFERRLRPSHPHVAVVLVNLGMLALDAGDGERACALLERAVEIREAAFGPEHPAVAYARVSYGMALTKAGRRESAVTHLQRALAVHRANGEEPRAIAEAERALAHALADAGPS
jgi:eukaryotic-like serine/threonine-protein kinase